MRAGGGVGGPARVSPLVGGYGGEGVGPVGPRPRGGFLLVFLLVLGFSFFCFVFIYFLFCFKSV